MSEPPPSSYRLFVGSAAGVLVGLAIPIALLVIATVPEPPPEEGDAYVRGALGALVLLPGLLVLLVAFHGLAAALLRHGVRAVWLVGALPLVVSVVVPALLVVEPSVDSVSFFALPLWGILALGTAAQVVVTRRRLVALHEEA